MKDIDPYVLNVELSVDAVIPECKVWLCPVCGLKRNIGNHQKCSKITQQKHKKERELIDKIKADSGKKRRKID